MSSELSSELGRDGARWLRGEQKSQLHPYCTNLAPPWLDFPELTDSRMGEWCVNQHGASGLTAACIASPHTYDEVAANVLAYIQKWIPERGAGLLAGSSVHADMR